MKNTALLVIDVQNTIVDYNPYAFDEVAANIVKLIDTCRDNETEVIFVQHCENDDDDFLVGSEGWQLYKDIVPLDNEKRIYKKDNSAFAGTDLKQYLDERNIDTLIITGMMTEYCINEAAKAANDLGYKIIMPQKTNTTADDIELNKVGKDVYEHYNNNVFKDYNAMIKNIDETVKMINS